MSSVLIDYERGLIEAIEHVAALGHHRAAVIAGPEKNRTAVTTKKALIRGLKLRGFNPDPVTYSDYHLDAGASVVRVILAAKNTLTVIFCGSDLIAMGAMAALEAEGLNVPEDISVVGIDDISFAFLAHPPLTTISVPREQLDITSFQALEKMLKLKRHKGLEYVLETKLVIRASTAIAFAGTTFLALTAIALALRRRRRRHVVCRIAIKEAIRAEQKANIRGRHHGIVLAHLGMCVAEAGQ